MIDYQYPDRFTETPKDKILLLDPPKGYQLDCENCGGLGTMYAFMINKGPFINVPPTSKGEVIKSTFDQHYGWMWFVGKTMGLDCPVCDGVGRVKGKKRKPPTKPEAYEDHTV